jgi:hypothetical protein
MFDGAPGGGWVVRSATGGVYYQRLLRSNSTYNDNGGAGFGASTHTHVNATTTTGNNLGGNPGNGDGLLGGGAISTHTHDLTAVFNSSSQVPEYYNVVIAEKVNFILEQYRWMDSTGTLSLNSTTNAWGALDTASNLSILPVPAAYRPPDYGDELRLRLQVSVNNNALAANEIEFKLQYKADTDANCTTGSWTDVDVAGGPGLWRFSSSTAIADGSTITGTSVFNPVSPIFQRYARSSNPGTNPNAAGVGVRMEYDFHIQHNENTNGATIYSFRIVEDSGILLSQYGDSTNNLCPTLTTKPQANNQLRHGDFFDSSGRERGFSWSD